MSATYQLGTDLLAEADEADAVIGRTRALAGRLTARLRGNLRRYVHDEDTLAAFKRELEDFDLRGNHWKRR